MNKITIIFFLLMSFKSLSCELSNSFKIRSKVKEIKYNSKTDKNEFDFFFLKELKPHGAELVEIHIPSKKCSLKKVPVSFEVLHAKYKVIETDTSPITSVEELKWKKIPSKKDYTVNKKGPSVIIGPFDVHSIYEKVKPSEWFFKLKIKIQGKEYIIDSPLGH